MRSTTVISVRELFHDPQAIIELSVRSALELFTALNARSQGDRFEDIWGQYWQIVDNVRAVDEAMAAKAVKLRRAAGRRLPNGDALIAATAVLADATLVHCDPHFSAISPALLQQLERPQK